MLTEGYSSKITFAADADVDLWEKEVTPPGVDAGDMIDITTMFNSTWRTFAFRALKTVSEASMTVAYDPLVLDQIIALVGVNTLVTIWFPNTDTWVVQGGLRFFQPSALVHGQQPEAACTIAFTNWDGSSEVAPDYHASPGTGTD